MIRMTRILMVAAVSCSTAYIAEAADLSQPPRVLNYPTAVADPGVTGWYIRGDVGVGIESASSWYESTISQPQGGNQTSWLNKDLDDVAFLSAGVGYQFNDNLRGDLTLQYRVGPTFQTGDTISNANLNGGATGVNSIAGTVSSTVLMLNGYYDVTHWNGLTPYVGLGAGVAYNYMHASSQQLGGFTVPLEYGVYPGKGNFDLAYALHTGVSYDVNSRLKLEMGYTFQGLGDAKAGPLSCYGGPIVVCNDQLRLKKLYSSDFHIGMRWLFDVPVSASASSSYQSSSYQQSSSWQAPASQTTWQAPSSQTTWAPAQSGGPVVARY